MRWADEEPATQSGFRIGASQQVRLYPDVPSMSTVIFLPL